MIPLVILSIIVLVVYAVYRATWKWGVSVLWFLGAGVSFLGAAGVLAEHLWGPQWSWNFAGHGQVYAGRALVQGTTGRLGDLAELLPCQLHHRSSLRRAKDRFDHAHVVHRVFQRDGRRGMLQNRP